MDNYTFPIKFIDFISLISELIFMINQLIIIIYITTYFIIYFIKFKNQI